MLTTSMMSRGSATLAVLLLAACGRKDEATTDSAGASASAVPTPAATAAAPATAAALNDAQVAHIALTANTIDSTAGALAKQKGTAKAVKDFGETMVNDHAGVNRQAVALATKLNVKPEDNDVSRELARGGEQNMSTLQGLSGVAFDSAYIAHEVDYHQAVLDALDRTLIPGTQNAELKALLTKVRPGFVAHLERAKSVRAGLRAR